MQGKPVFNTHSHFLEPSTISPYNLDSLLANSYVNWRLKAPTGIEGRAGFLDAVRTNSYFVWLQKSLQSLYGLDGPITAANWDELSHRIAAAHAGEGRSLAILKDVCGYENVLHDPYWNPQQANPHPGFFAPAYRINMFLYGWCREAHDHNGHNAQTVLGTDIRDIDEYVAMMRNAILRRKAEGCVALKSALAYDRELDFRETPKNAAQKALSAGCGAGDEEIQAFQDYVFFAICHIAAELGMQLQNHTGLGHLRRTNAMQMREVIEKNPDTKFVLFHGSYPYTDDIGGLLHNFGNVYPDLCWLPLISSSACERLLAELIDVGTSDKISWGCDTWTAEESFGALLAARHVIAKVLSVKVKDGYLTLPDAEKFAERILHDNAVKLYFKP
jgi:glucuronate isomerase